ncbi:hypothetical protein FXO38_11847 [Capsicum annuum]|nr:hypothetical protein FXO38_11847 [Capsicum annuum]
MASILKRTSKLAGKLLNPKLLSTSTRSISPRASFNGGSVRFASTSEFSYVEKKNAPRRLPAACSYLLRADERSHSTGNEAIPKVTLKIQDLVNSSIQERVWRTGFEHVIKQGRVGKIAWSIKDLRTHGFGPHLMTYSFWSIEEP